MTEDGVLIGIVILSFMLTVVALAIYYSRSF
jgi:hypothetical protein